MYENSRFLKNRFTFCGVNTNFGQQWAPPAYHHLTPIVSKGKHCSVTGLSVFVEQISFVDTMSQFLLYAYSWNNTCIYPCFLCKHYF